MPRLSSERGQGATEYILILALALIFILGLLFVFRNSIGGATQKMTAAVSGKAVEKSAGAGASEGSGGSEAAANSGGSDQKEKSAGAAGESPNDGAAAAAESGEGASESAAEGEQGAEENENSRIATKESGETGNQARGMNFAERGTRGVALWILIGIAGFLVLIVVYFLSATSR